MKDRNDRIVIVGAGPSGLMTAHYLKQAGFTNVVVLEKLGRVGGMVRSVTMDGRSFDLGANYITPAYTETLKLARELGCEMYMERPFVAMSIPESSEEEVTFRRMIDAMRVVDGETVPMEKFLSALVTYFRLRSKLSHIIDQPSFAGVEKHPELCVPLLEWLKANDIACLQTLFELPITLMGFGYVWETSAIYALKFITPETFVPLVLKRMPGIGPHYPWPKRFTEGFQRLYEKLSWRLDVRLEADITRIDRDEEGVTVHYTMPDQVQHKMQRRDHALKADHLILACPLTPDVIGNFLELSEGERALFEPVETFSYCVTTLEVRDLSVGDQISGAGPLAAVFPVAPMGLPWGVAKQWDDCDLVQFYSPIDGARLDEDVREEMLGKIERVVDQMGGTIIKENAAWHTWNRWPYFQHVSCDEVASGYYTRLEEQQGRQNTWYVGGVTNFQLIEPIAQYSKHVVRTWFSGESAPTRTRRRDVPLGVLKRALRREVTV